MQVYIIIEAVQSESPENSNRQVSKFFETFAEAQAELQCRYNATAEKKTFNQSVATREL